MSRLRLIRIEGSERKIKIWGKKLAKNDAEKE